MGARGQTRSWPRQLRDASSFASMANTTPHDDAMEAMVQADAPGDSRENDSATECVRL